MLHKLFKAASSVFTVAVMNLSVLCFTMYFGAADNIQGFSEYILSLSFFSLAVILFDFGLNTALVRDDTSLSNEKLKLVIDSKKLISFLFLIILSLCFFMSFLYSELNAFSIISAIASASFYSLWLTYRVKDQINVDFLSFNKKNIQFMFVRVFSVVIFLLANVDVSYGVFFLYGLPALLLIVDRYYFTGHLEHAVRLRASLPELGILCKYGGMVMLSALVYTVTLNSAVLFYSAYNNDELVAAIGWAIAPVAIVSLVFTVLRPFWLSYNSRNTLNRNTLLKIISTAILFILIGLIVLFYTVKFSNTLSLIFNVPSDWIVASIIAIVLVLLNCLFGLISALLHKLNKPLLDLKYNFLRLIFVSLGLFFLGNDTNVVQVILTIFTIIILVEISLCLNVYNLYRKVYY